MTFDGATYCDSCHLIIAPKDPGALHYGKVDYHASCYLRYRKKNENPRPQFITALLLALLVVISFGAQAADRKLKKPTEEKGCYFTYYPQSGEIRFEPFLKTSDKDYPDENGEAEIWGYRPFSGAARDEKDIPIKVNVLSSRFLPLGRNGPIPAGTRSRYARCPSGYW